MSNPLQTTNEFVEVFSDIAALARAAAQRFLLLAKEAVARCETAMQAALRDQASASRSQPYYLDVTHLEATKGGVVEFLSRSMNIPEEAIATLGDMPNDVSMFEKSGLSIAMGNASKEVQAQANFVSLSNEEEGFAYAIENFVLRTHPSVSATEPSEQQRS